MKEVYLLNNLNMACGSIYKLKQLAMETFHADIQTLSRMR